MTSRKRIFEQVTNVDQLIPDLADIVTDYAGYTEQECNENTNNAAKCWNYGFKHEDCDRYCINNIDNWIYPFFAELDKDQENEKEYPILVVEDRKSERSLSYEVQDLEVALENNSNNYLEIPQKLYFPNVVGDLYARVIIEKKTLEIYTTLFSIKFSQNLSKEYNEIYVEVTDSKLLELLPSQEETNTDFMYSNRPTYEKRSFSLRIRWWRLYQRINVFGSFGKNEILKPLLQAFIQAQGSQTSVDNSVHVNYSFGTNQTSRSELLLEWLTKSLNLPKPKNYTEKEVKKIVGLINSKFILGLANADEFRNSLSTFVLPGDMSLTSFVVSEYKGRTSYGAYYYNWLMLRFNTFANFFI